MANGNNTAPPDRTGSFEWIIRAVGGLLGPLETPLAADEIRNLIYVDLGISLAPGSLDATSLATTLAAIATAASQLPDEISNLNSALSEDQVDVAAQQAAKLIQDIQTTVAAIHKTIAELQKLSGTLPGITDAQLQQFAANLPARILELLTIKYLDEFLIRKEWLLLLGWLDQQLIPIDPQHSEQGFFVREQLHLDRVLPLLKDPIAYGKTVYGWGDAAFQANLLLDRFGKVLALTGLPATLTPGTAATPASLEFFFFTLRENRQVSPPGLELDLKFPIAAGFDFTLPISAAFSAEFSSTGQFEPGLRLLVQPPSDLKLLPVSATLNGGLQARLVGKNPDTSQPFVILGATGGSRLEAVQVALGFALSATMATGAPAAHGDVLVDAEITGGKLILDTSGEDGFLSSLIPGEKLEASIDFGVSWSPAKGLSFKGSAGLEIVLPVNRSIGPVQLQELHLISGLDTNSNQIPLEVSGAFSGQIGPISVTVDRLGFVAHFSLPPGGGNIGPVAFDLSFKPPNGVGLVVDADVVVGGGYLAFDSQKAEYSGVLDLQIAETIAVKAIGLLDTRLPDGSKGYSLVAIVFAEGFTPIQLGLGFSLTGIGGLLAINRTFDETALRAGLKNHTLDSILFPADPVRNAPQIISNLNKVFPPASGHHLFGPMAQIAWGSPVLVTANLALVLEFGARLRLLILAQLIAILPTRDNDLLRLQMDAAGVIDFDQGTAAIDATLHDSRLLKKFVLTGDMAMRLAWKGSRNFALAVGGLHPAFNPPPNFPKLDRIAISLSSGDNPRIRCEAYFALTANTQQFGAQAELYASAAGFSIHGEIGYDVLLQLNPFSFVADFHAQLQLMHGSTNLFKVKVEGELGGPHPLHVKAKATFEILWWDVSINIDKTLSEGEQPPQLAPVDVLPLLKAALSSPANWTGQLPAGQRPVVTIRANAGTPGGVSLHPLGTLTVRQNTVPLDLDISRFGQTAPSGATRFSISSVTVGTEQQTPQTVKDFFAPAQFLDLTDDEKLARPSFESMTAGVTFGSGDFVFTGDNSDWLEVPAIEFETIILDKDLDTSRPSGTNGPNNRYKLTAGLLTAQSRFGAAATSGVQRTGEAKYRTTTGKYRVVKEGWSIISTADLAIQQLPGLPAKTAVSYSEAEQSLRTLAHADSKQTRDFQILRLSEVGVAAG